jgi:hypothetical protein
MKFMWFLFVFSQLWTLCEVVPGDGGCLVVPVALLVALSSSNLLSYSNECFVGINFSLHLCAGPATSHVPVTPGLLLLPTIRTSWHSGMGWGNVLNEYSYLLSCFELTADIVISCLLEVASWTLFVQYQHEIYYYSSFLSISENIFLLLMNGFQHPSHIL